MLEKLVVFVEEYSMEAALEILLPKLLGDRISGHPFSVQGRYAQAPSFPLAGV